MEEVKICEYGCEEPAIHQFKNGKWCCSKQVTFCRSIIKKSGISKRKPIKENPGLCEYNCGNKSKYYFKTVKKWCCSKNYQSCPKLKREVKEKEKRKNPGLCEYNCGEKAIFQLKNEKWCCSKSANSCKQKRKKYSEEEKKEKYKTRTGIKRSEECKEKKRGKKIHSNEYKDRLRKEMLNGKAVFMNKCIKNPSKPEIMLREIIKELYPNSEPQYPILNYSVDIALVENKIAIEYDGWYHFNSEENKQYHKFRQEKIQKEGWKFLRYNIFQPFPTKEQIEKDIVSLRGYNAKTRCQLS